MFKQILWPVPTDCLDIDRDKIYIIHRILMNSKNLSQIAWLIRKYSKQIVASVFIQHPVKIYSRPAFYFMKNFVLSLSSTGLDEKNYIDESIPPRQSIH